MDDYIEILTGDFLKNSGIVAFISLLKEDYAKENDDYIIDGNRLQVKKEYLKNTNLTDLYFHCMVKRYQNETPIPKIIEEIQNILRRFDYENIDKKDIQDRLSFISDKLGAASFKTGINSIKDEVEDSDIYFDVINKSFKKSKINDELKEKLLELKKFLSTDIVFETLCFKSICYNIINKFWEKSFLLRNNAKKNMKECYEADFIKPLMDYLEIDTDKMNDQCIDCGNSINSKFSIPISFMCDFADDLARKKSALFNFNMDMSLCPICAFLYSLVPLGFIRYNNDYIFVNQNGSIEELSRVNTYNIEHTKERLQEDYQLRDKYQKIYQIIEGYELETQKLTNNNIQIITRSIKGNEQIKYEFDILDNYLIEIVNNQYISKTLEYFKKKNVIKINDQYLSVFREVLKRILNRVNMYDLINLLLRQSIVSGELSYLAYYTNRIVEIQYIIKGGKSMGELYHARKDGWDLRNKLENVDENYRGTIYQLTNALKVDDRNKFVDIILRIYTSKGLPIPFSISRVLESNYGIEIGYQFITGLKGAYESFGEKENNDDE
ncbi:MAG: hypothetical protein KHX14_04320 [[Clostridium] spiroforme]|uniref:Type I-B CRISPR-associated protein Cas8b1/Cst1 n=2 Tax=Bacillota TaxID=1239 RepID=A0A943EKD7_9FIRM|nr:MULTISPECIES: hypothetical protein [Thomasclavelia]MBS5588031.1 hypothetical protein [Thomasclavelia spiroformis]